MSLRGDSNVLILIDGKPCAQVTRAAGRIAYVGVVCTFGETKKSKSGFDLGD